VAHPLQLHCGGALDVNNEHVLWTLPYRVYSRIDVRARPICTKAWHCCMPGLAFTIDLGGCV
jgi:hypothetical protein